MQYITPEASGSSTTYRDFLDTFEALLPLDTDEKMADCVAPLRALSNTTEEMIRSLAKDLLDKIIGSTSWKSSANTFVLFQQGGDLIRLNVWRPLPKRSKFNAFNSRIFAYGFPHDHDFDLLTVGGLGPGYQTDIFSYRRDDVKGYPHEEIDSTSYGRFQLERGAILFYEQSKDIHIQHPCESTSVSINVITAGRKERQGGQFIFDETASHIRGFAENYATRVLKVTELLLASGISDGLAIVREIGARHRDPFVLRGIVEQISAREGESREEWAGRLGYDDLTFSAENQFASHSMNEMIIHI